MGSCERRRGRGVPYGKGVRGVAVATPLVVLFIGGVAVAEGCSVAVP